MNYVRKKVSLKGEVSEELRNKFKIACAIRRVTMSDALDEIVTKWIESQESTEKEAVKIGLSEAEFLNMLANSQRPDHIQLVTLSRTTGLPIELLEKITDCIFQGVTNGV